MPPHIMTEEPPIIFITDGTYLGHDSGMVKTRIFQQSVTLTAKMWPQENSTGSGSGPPRWSWSTWRVPSDQLPLVIAVLAGSALTLLLVLAVILWRCCVAPHRNKDYRVKMTDTSTIPKKTVVPVLPSHSAVFLDPKSGHWTVSSRIVGASGGGGCPGAVDVPGHWFYNNHVLNAAALEKCAVPRSISVPTHQNPMVDSKRTPPRPRSQPSSLSPVGRKTDGPPSLPQISEFNPHHNQSSLCASSSVLDECGSRDIYASPFGGTMMKTQSLPACVRNKTRPLSNADDPAELYAKVNFSKKRKNRMRNDEAAIIALSKSRSQFLYKDTDSLVDNEAVIVYDERTAL